MVNFHRKALQYFVALGVLSLLSLQTNGQDVADEIVRIDTNLVNLVFTAWDRDNRLITNLTREDLQIFEDGKAQKILLFESETNRALNVAILVDISGSQKTTLELEKTTIRAFVESVLQNRDDKVALVSFAADPHRVLRQAHAQRSSHCQTLRRQNSVGAPAGRYFGQ